MCIHELLGSKSELYFMHEGSILQPGSSVVITDIGSQPTDSAQPGSTLVCVTTNVNRRCCSTNDNDGVVGNWRGPNGMLIMPHDRFSANDKFTSIASDEQVWLSRGSEVRGPTGKYTCEVPRQGNRNIITASITIITGKNNGFKNGWMICIVHKRCPYCDFLRSD